MLVKNLKIILPFVQKERTQWEFFSSSFHDVHKMDFWYTSPFYWPVIGFQALSSFQ